MVMVWDDILIAITLAVISAMLMPKPKQPKPAAASQGDNPVASAGKPIPVVFGTVTIKESNVLWYGEKNIRTYKVKA